MPERKARLAQIERELSALRAQYDLAMSSFKFDSATALQRRIAPLERERASLDDGGAPPPEPPTGIVPVLKLPPRRRR